MVSTLQKPRFEDNGDIEPCDTESLMMRIEMLNSPDDSGVSEASSHCLTEVRNKELICHQIVFQDEALIWRGQAYPISSQI